MNWVLTPVLGVHHWIPVNCGRRVSAVDRVWIIIEYEGHARSHALSSQAYGLPWILILYVHAEVWSITRAQKLVRGGLHISLVLVRWLVQGIGPMYMHLPKTICCELRWPLLRQAEMARSWSRLSAT